MTFAFGTTITVIHDSPGGYDEFGDPVAGTTTETEIANCAVAPRYSTEPTERGRVGVIVGKTLFVPPSATIVFDDRIVIDEVTYTVEGQPGSWVQPMTGTDFGFEVALVRAVG